jgi:hypothetical protein
MIVAALTGKREVLQSCRAALGARNDVLYGERLRGIAGLAATVLAASICALSDLLAQLRIDALLRHGLGTEYQALPSTIWHQVFASANSVSSITFVPSYYFLQFACI